MKDLEYSIPIWKIRIDWNGVNENGKKWFKIGNLVDDCEDTVEGHLGNSTPQQRHQTKKMHIKSWAH